MSRGRIPWQVDPEIRVILEDIYLKLDRMTGANNVDLHGRRFMNAGSAEADTDYVTLADLRSYVLKVTGKGPRGAIIGTEAGETGAGAGGGGGTGGCAGRNAPTVDFPDGLSIIEDYTDAHPGEIEDSCIDDGGTWTWMDGVVAALQAVDERYGYNAQRGNPDDLSHDAISYYHGSLGTMTVGSRDCFVIDIIASHCGASPTPAFQDVTGADCGGWIPTRS